MDEPPVNPAPRHSLSGAWPWLVVLVVVLFIGFIRFRLLDMPLERDEGEYAYAGQLILQGVPPYELAYNMKLPGTYFAYAAGMAVFGQTIAGVHLTLIAANSLTILFVFLLARKLFDVTAGLFACTSYGLMSVCPFILGTAAHANHFVVLFAVPATWLLLKAIETGGKKALFLSGLLYGLAFLMKQQGMFFILFGWLLLLGEGRRGTFSAGFGKRILWFGAGTVVPFGLTCLGLWWAGVFGKFWFWTFTYARVYATTYPLSQGLHALVGHLLEMRYVSAGFWFLVVVGVPVAWYHRSFRKSLVIALLFLVCSFFCVATGFYFRGHYFILILPAFAVLVGMAVAVMQRAIRFQKLENVGKSLPLILFAMISAWVIYYQADYFFSNSALQVAQELYQYNPIDEPIAVAGYIREHSGPSARIAVLGSEPEIYFYAHRRSATGYIYVYALMERQSHAAQMQHEMIGEIESARPEYIVFVSYAFSWLKRADSDHTIFDWFGTYSKEFYDKVGIIDVSPDGEFAIWGDAAKKYPDSADPLFAIYRRKPAEPAK